MHNPYAFPHPSGAQGCDGMTLRDWFAGQALAGILAHETDDCAYEPQLAAHRAYMMADAMLTERTKPHD